MPSRFPDSTSAVLVAAVLAFVIGGAWYSPALSLALPAGAMAGIAWLSTSFGINYLFERKSLTLFLVNAGYHTVQFTTMGLVLGLWH